MWKVSLRPRYFWEAWCGKISMFKLLRCACSGCCGCLRRCILCSILVLSGCNSSPTRSASWAVSLSIVLSWGRDVANKSMSSANLRFVRVVLGCADSCMPHRRVSHFCRSRRKNDSESALNNKELRSALNSKGGV